MVNSAHCSLHNSTDELFLPIGSHSAHSDSECQVLELAGQVVLFLLLNFENKVLSCTSTYCNTQTGASNIHTK